MVLPGLRTVAVCVCLPLWAMAASLENPLSSVSARFRTDTSVVLVPVTVTDKNARPVLTLGRENFEITEDGRPRPVSYFLQEDAPVSVAIVVDLSGSMSDKIGLVREAVTRFLATANPEDEFCLIELRDGAEVVDDFGSRAQAILEHLAMAQPAGHTALLDGMYLAFDQMKKAHNPRKTLLAISDGGENHSRFTSKEVRRVAVESGAAIYALELPPPVLMWVPEQPQLLDDLAADTGGRDYVVETAADISGAVEKIGIDLRSQYVLGYIASLTARDGKYHRIHVKVVMPSGSPRLSAYWRRGYFAPKD
jgi:Ca-activated chloride channel homolog